MTFWSVIICYILNVININQELYYRNKGTVTDGFCSIILYTAAVDYFLVFILIVWKNASSKILQLFKFYKLLVYCADEWKLKHLLKYISF